MHVRAVRNDFFFCDRRRHFVFEPIEAHALRDGDLIKHALVRHWPPAERKIDRNECGLMIPAINFSVEHARINGEMGQRFQIELAVRHRFIRGRRLLGLGGNQNARRISDRSMEIIPTEDGRDDRQ